MCSISGFCLSPDSHINPTKLAQALLVAGESRGEDACGYSYLTPDSTIVTKTRAMSPTQFTSKGFRLPSSTRTAILHTRFATQGSPTNPLNNHPIERQTALNTTVSLVHNGVLDNDNQIFADYGYSRNAQVDSEALPALLADFKAGDVAGAMREVIGAYACGYLDERLPHTLTLLRGNSSPLLVAEISATPPSKSPRSKTPRSKIEGVIFASTITMLEAGLASIGLSLSSKRVSNYSLKQGQYMTVNAGTWDGLVYPFTVATRWSKRQWDSKPSADLGTGWSGRYDAYSDDTTLGYPKARYGQYSPSNSGYDESETNNLMLHMEWCDSNFCCLGHPTSCPVNEQQSWVGRSSQVNLPSEEQIAAVVKAWTKRDRRLSF